MEEGRHVFANVSRCLRRCSYYCGSLFGTILTAGGLTGERIEAVRVGFDPEQSFSVQHYYPDHTVSVSQTPSSQLSALSSQLSAHC